MSGGRVLKHVDKCSHNKTFDKDCEKCEIVSLKESIRWDKTHLLKNEARLSYLESKTK